MDFLLSLGELFTLVVYGQLIIEKIKMDRIDPDLLDQIFDFMVRDFGAFALQLYTRDSSTPQQMALCREMIRKPVDAPERFQRIWQDQVTPLKDAYAMNL
jgi:acyl-CoA dehydrogenase